MNDNNGYWRRQLRPLPRWAAVLAAITAMAGIALLAAACGGGNPSADGRSTLFDKALAYTHCMRAHGMLIYPDPNSQGELPALGTVSGPAKQTVLSAQNACRHLLQSYEMSNGHLSGAQQQHLLSQMVKYAQCMRAHGVPNWPDPTIGNNGIGFNTAGIPTASPQFMTAQQACKSLAANAKGHS